MIEPDTGPENSDAARAAELVAADTSVAGHQVDVLGDSAYGSGKLLATVQAAGHTPIIKPMPLGTAVPDGFSVDDFTVDETANTVTCPAGAVRPINTKGRVSFGGACGGCPLMGRCTTAKSGKKMHTRPHDRIRREHRARATDPDFQAVYPQHWPMVARSIAWMTRGARRVLYRGVAKNNAWWANRAAGINLKRLLNLGLTGQNGSWVLR